MDTRRMPGQDDRGTYWMEMVYILLLGVLRARAAGAARSAARMLRFKFTAPGSKRVLRIIRVRYSVRPYGRTWIPAGCEKK